MKKNTMMRIASVLLIAVLMTTCVISGTFAKYTSSANATGTANIAKWSFEVDGNDIAAEENFTFLLFATIDPTDELSEDDDVADGDDDVAEGNIAPGTTGSIVLTLENTSEVTATYSIALTSSNESDVPIEYTLTDPAELDTVWTSNITDLAPAGEIASNGSTTVTVYWRWAFDGDDTSIGVNADTTTLSVTAAITATQKN